VTRVLALLAAAGVLLVSAAPVSAAPSPARQIAVLQQQVKALRNQVKALRLELQANYIGDACLAASTADVFQSTWATIDDYVEPTAMTRLFGPPDAAPVADKSACEQGLKIQRQQSRPPTAVVFQALINWLV
jgi:hypothetical protein